MIPLSDASRRPVRFPAVTLGIILLNFLVFIVELVAGEPFIERWSMVPAQVSAGHDLITVLTAMFLHGGWAHILGNMVFLWAFGPQIEDTMGPVRYAVFYLLGGVAAAVAQILSDPSSTIPTLGASGAIAAVMGAFLVTYPRDKIRTVLFIGWFGWVTYIPAVLLIGVWFLTQLVSEVGALSGAQGEGVAYVAHIGGLLFGFLAAPLFEVNASPAVAEAAA